MTEPTRKEAAAQIRSAINTAIWVGITAEEVRAIVVAHLIDRGDDRKSEEE